MKDFIFITFATSKQHYLNKAKVFEETANKHNINYHIDYFEQFGDYKDISLYRPTYILEKLKEFKKTVIWIDCDSVFEGKPDYSFMDKKFDVGVLRRIGEGGRVNPRMPILNFINVFNYTEKSKKVLKVWKFLNSWRDMSHVRNHGRFVCARYFVKHTNLDVNSYFKGSVVGFVTGGKKRVDITTYSDVGLDEKKMKKDYLLW